ncbi:hypothetical protein GCM10023142_02510 [Anaerocolumna aminovalerica]|jgi:hypothetical protein|uniref:Glycosyl hydrolases family 28 n=1 Tax=Anaerocolumna aminovalerica TaxID=1527 RepID=A0A1I5BN38_9FIRM|nr:glycosyl hydrolase family 28 protein [Anaerocolumna aminovalerica]MDU6264461.1 glycosyl hydrolase family 28 protein [Anaerocolumna aminovalerica]SFN76113.1 Glycosyl hydrolases family 28 [Anaerocolumna aminovalerica]
MEKGKKVMEFAQWFVIFALIIIAVFAGKRLKDRTKEISRMLNYEGSKLVLYEGPKSLQDAKPEDLLSESEKQRNFALLHCTDTKVKVNGYDCYVYDTNVNHNRVWYPDYMPPQSRTPITYFDFEGMAKIEVSVPAMDLKSVKISPLSYHIIPEVDLDSKTVTFTITKPDNYTVIFNDSPERALHIFANTIEKDAPTESTENIKYIGPGEWNIENIILEDNQTLYLAGGAVVHGIINANYAKNIKVEGRGILDGSSFQGWMGKTAYVPLKFDNCDGVTIKDIIVLNSNAWVCSAKSSVNGVIDGIRIISSRPNGDGITLQSCNNYRIENSFVRSWDDSLVLKNYEGSSSHISFENMQLWTDFAQSMEIGYETNKGQAEDVSISDITFRNITVLNNFHKPVISVHNADDAIIKEVTFQNITVENAQMGSGDGDEMPYLIDIHIPKTSNWTSTKERGTIDHIIIDNVKVLSGKFSPSRVEGFDENHKISNVSISNLEILSEKITGFEQGKFQIDPATTENIIIK